jgi:hypothetical protein
LASFNSLFSYILLIFLFWISDEIVNNT